MKQTTQKEIFTVSGMTCSACEQRIENSLAKQAGIVHVSSKFSNSQVEIEFNPQEISVPTIQDLLEKAGYPAEKTAKKQTDTKLLQWGKSILVLAAIIVAFVLLEQTGIFNLFPMADQNTALPLLFVIGLLTSVHCIAMCGGINISQCTSVALPAQGKKARQLLPSLLYNAGRVVSYTVIGGIVGAIGSMVTPSGRFKGIVAIVAGVFMLIMGISMVGIFPFLRKFVPRMPKIFAKKVNKERVGKGPFVIGLLNGFMPCGPLQAMQLYALSTGSFLMGALSMFLFSLGTVPLMFLLGALSSILSSKFTNIMMKVSAVLVILLGLMMMNNGLSLSGFNALF